MSLDGSEDAEFFILGGIKPLKEHIGTLVLEDDNLVRLSCVYQGQDGIAFILLKNRSRHINILSGHLDFPETPCNKHAQDNISFIISNLKKSIIVTKCKDDVEHHNMFDRSRIEEKILFYLDFYFPRSMMACFKKDDSFYYIDSVNRYLVVLIEEHNNRTGFGFPDGFVWRGYSTSKNDSTISNTSSQANSVGEDSNYETENYTDILRFPSHPSHHLEGHNGIGIISYDEKSSDNCEHAVNTTPHIHIKINLVLGEMSEPSPQSKQNTKILRSMLNYGDPVEVDKKSYINELSDMLEPVEIRKRGLLYADTVYKNILEIKDVRTCYTNAGFQPRFRLKDKIREKMVDLDRLLFSFAIRPSIEENQEMYIESLNVCVTIFEGKSNSVSLYFERVPECLGGEDIVCPDKPIISNGVTIDVEDVIRDEDAKGIGDVDLGQKESNNPAKKLGMQNDIQNITNIEFNPENNVETSDNTFAVIKSGEYYHFVFRPTTNPCVLEKIMELLVKHECNVLNMSYWIDIKGFQKHDSIRKPFFIKFPYNCIKKIRPKRHLLYNTVGSDLIRGSSLCDAIGNICIEVFIQEKRQIERNNTFDLNIVVYNEYPIENEYLELVFNNKNVLSDGFSCLDELVKVDLSQYGIQCITVRFLFRKMGNFCIKDFFILHAGTSLEIQCELFTCVEVV